MDLNAQIFVIFLIDEPVQVGPKSVKKLTGTCLNKDYYLKDGNIKLKTHL